MEAGGEIVVLDTANYGAISITKHVTIASPLGVGGFITISSGATAVAISSGLRVTFKGLTIEAIPRGSVGAGILASNVASLKIENCTITGFSSGSSATTGGVVIDTSGNASQVALIDSVTDCAGVGVSHGLSGSSTDSKLVVERCRVLSNGQGIFSGASGRAVIRDSVIAGNSSAGIRGGGITFSEVKVNVENCVLNGNGIGIQTAEPSNVSVSNSNINGNTRGVSGGPLTYGNNRLGNNGTDGSMGATQTLR